MSMTPEAEIQWLREHMGLLQAENQWLRESVDSLSAQREAAEKKVEYLTGVMQDHRKFYVDLMNGANAEASRFQTLLRESEAKVERLQADAKSTRRYENGLEDGRVESMARIKELEELAYIGEPHPGSAWKDYCHEVETMVASLQTALKEMEVERDAWKSTYLTAKAKEWKLIQPWRYPENK